jgi:D-alanyl-D-alanine carboxypeptidase
VDIIDTRLWKLVEAQEELPAQKWLMENSWKYGFILRYQKDKTNITGVIYEPWHYRYVGKDAAKAIYESGLTLEEYLAQ